MTADPLNDVVSRQYEQWMYPAPIMDLAQWLDGRWQWFDPSHAHSIFWPDRDYPTGLDILVAGCGTNQAAVLAYTNPTARVVAIDVSDASLAHHRYLAERHSLANLEVHRMPIEDASALGRDFDLILSTGVLHHLADPEIGMRVLADLLRPDGVMAVMLYGTYGRVGVHMLQSVFRDMGLGQDDVSIGFVKDALTSIDPGHPVVNYLGITSDLDDDAGIVDTFLHGRERTYTIDECQALVASAGLTFQDIFINAPYYAPRGTDHPFWSAVAALPKEQQWSSMERLNPRNACHYFMACRTDRPREQYAIDFSSAQAMTYVPSLRYACRLKADVLHRHDLWQLPLNAHEADLIERVDGHTSIEAILAEALQSEAFSTTNPSAVTAEVIEMFRMLWQLDFLSIRLSPPLGTSTR